MNKNKQICKPGDEGSVTVSISRQVKPGSEAAYEQWISGIVNAASHYPGHLGTSILRPNKATDDKYVIIYRFNNYENCQTWEHSETRHKWLNKLGGLTEGQAKTIRGTGLEFWFDLPELPAYRPPSAHKMALVLIVVVYVLVMGFNMIFIPIIEPMPLWLKTALIVIFQVLFMTYIVMPKVSKILKNWLFN